MRLNATVFNVKPAKRGDYSPVDYVLNPVPGQPGKNPHKKEGRRVWGNLRRMRLPGLGMRWVAPCDLPEPALFARRRW